MNLVPLKRLAAIRVSNVDKKTADQEVPVRLCNYTDVYYRDEIAPNQDFMAATATPDQIKAFRLLPGDVIITKDSETPDDIGVPTYVRATAPDLICGYHLAMLRPDRSKLDGRFLYWFMSSTPAREQLAVAATGVTRFGLRADSTGAVLIPVWPASRQRTIADYLDTETARIDALIALKQRQLDVLREREQALREHAFRHGPGWLLKRLLRARMAYGVLVPRLVDPDTGNRMLRINTLTAGGGVDISKAAWIQTDQHLQYRRTIVASGDLVLSVVGSMGRSAVVDTRSEGSNLNRPLARLRFRVDLPTRLMWHWTQTRQFLDQAALATGGDTAQPTLNLGDLADFRVGLSSDPANWPTELEVLEQKLNPISQAQHGLVAQLGLISEHRRALITAAVTGDIEVRGAS